MKTPPLIVESVPDVNCKRAGGVTFQVCEPTSNFALLPKALTGFKVIAVIPAEAGIQAKYWIPHFAGAMTRDGNGFASVTIKVFSARN